MIEHYLNGVRVYPSNDEKITITSENAILTTSGSYTLEVDFPLKIFENRDFFGSLDRTEVTKRVVTWDVEIYNNGAILLLGTATLTKATEEKISVQYIAGNSEVNFWDNAESTYIDEMDYNIMDDGRDRVEAWIDEQKLFYTFVDRYNYKDTQDEGTTKFVRKGARLFRESKSPFFLQLPFIGRQGIFAFCNVYDEDYDYHEDEQGVIEWEEELQIGNGTYWDNRMTRSHRIGDIIYIEEFSGACTFINCIQPNLLWVIKQLVAKRGYTIDRNDIEELEYVKEIYIASARQTLSIADALPHWTLKTFFDEVQKFFNCTIVFDEVKRSCSFIMTNKILNSQCVNLTELVEEHEENITSGENANANIWVSNIRYKDIGKEEERRCDDSMRKKYETVWGESKEELLKKAQSTDDAAWKFYRMRGGGGHTWGYSEGVLKDIDHLCPLDRGSESYVDLKIIPARMKSKFYVSAVHNSELYTEPYRGLILRRMLTVSNSWGGYKTREGDIVKEVLGQKIGEGNGDKEDFMPVFLYRSHKAGDCQYAQDYIIEGGKGYYGGIYSRGGTVTTQTADAYTGKNWLVWGEGNYRGNYSLALVSGHTPIYHGQVFDGNPKINMEAELQLRFRADTPPDARATFFIKGKKYLASKIEYNIDEEGIDPLMTGYFHEILEG